MRTTLLVGDVTWCREVTYQAAYEARRSGAVVQRQTGQTILTATDGRVTRFVRITDPDQIRGMSGPVDLCVQPNVALTQRAQAQLVEIRRHVGIANLTGSEEIPTPRPSPMRRTVAMVGTADWFRITIGRKRDQAQAAGHRVGSVNGRLLVTRGDGRRTTYVWMLRAMQLQGWAGPVELWIQDGHTDAHLGEIVARVEHLNRLYGAAAR